MINDQNQRKIKMNNEGRGNPNLCPLSKENISSTNPFQEVFLSPVCCFPQKIHPTCKTNIGFRTLLQNVTESLALVFKKSLLCIIII
jgi:hypothetical protein